MAFQKMTRITVLYRKILGFASLLIMLFCSDSAFSQERNVAFSATRQEQTIAISSILKAYEITAKDVEVARYEGVIGEIEYVDVFRVLVSDDCTSGPCFYVVLPSKLNSTPIMTQCRFEKAYTNHFFHPDGSKFLIFDFTCDSSTLQLQISKDHDFVSSSLR